MAMNELERAPGASARSRRSLRELEQHRGFVDRHIGTDDADQAAMLRTLGFATRGALIDAIVPAAIRSRKPLALPAAKGEEEALEELRGLAAKNRVYTTYIGQGYYGTYTPGVILRNVLENPAWYTAYTPYQPEISQGRLEALVNFQTMICDLCAMAIANASMLDEATAAAEAHGAVPPREPAIEHDDIRRLRCAAADDRCRANEGGAAGHRRRRRARRSGGGRDCFAVMLQYPGADGDVRDYRDADREAARQRRDGDRRIRPARVDDADAAGRMGRRRSRRLESALRRADGLRRSARRVPRHARRIQAQSSRTAGRRQRRCQRRPGISTGAADARAAHPA